MRMLSFRPAAEDEVWWVRCPEVLRFFVTGKDRESQGIRHQTALQETEARPELSLPPEQTCVPASVPWRGLWG